MASSTTCSINHVSPCSNDGCIHEGRSARSMECTRGTHLCAPLLPLARTTGSSPGILDSNNFSSLRSVQESSHNFSSVCSMTGNASTQPRFHISTKAILGTATKAICMMVTSFVTYAWSMFFSMRPAKKSGGASLESNQQATSSGHADSLIIESSVPMHCTQTSSDRSVEMYREYSIVHDPTERTREQNGATATSGKLQNDKVRHRARFRPVHTICTVRARDPTVEQLSDIPCQGWAGPTRVQKMLFRRKWLSSESLKADLEQSERKNGRRIIPLIPVTKEAQEPRKKFGKKLGTKVRRAMNKFGRALKKAVVPSVDTLSSFES